MQVAKEGNPIYLGLSERGARHILHTLTWRFLGVWTGTVFLGFLISYLSTRRTLRRVERITETVARIGSKGLDERLPEPAAPTKSPGWRRRSTICWTGLRPQ